jgi:hypothetical protein
LTNVVRDRAQRLITVIRDRAFAELARRGGELAPLALTMDADGRIGSLAVYTGDHFPHPENQLADLRATLKLQVALHTLESAVIAHYERISLASEVHPLDSVEVEYETRSGKPLSVSFPYRIKVKLQGDSEVTPLAAVTRPGRRALFP